MNFSRMQVYRNPNIGVYIYANNKVALVPPGVSRGVVKTIEDTLDVECIETTIAGSRINGVFVAGNDKILFIPPIARDEEIQSLKDQIGDTLEITVLETKNTALGNLIVINNKAAIVSPSLEETTVQKIKEKTGLPIIKKSFLGIPTVGSMMVVNDHTGLAHPLIPENELEEAGRELGIEIGPATVNEGVGFVKTGVLLNNNGVIVGEDTTGPEIMNIHSLVSR